MRTDFILFLCLILTLHSCKEDEGIDCSLIDCAFQTFYIELVDVEGNNLIANDTYDQGIIIVTKDGNQLNSNLSTSDVINFVVMGEVGTNTYEIKLNDSETDMLTLNLSGDNIKNSCCGPYYEITAAIYNGEEQEVLQAQYHFANIVVIK